MMRKEALTYMNDKQALLSGDIDDPDQQKNLLPDLYVRSDLFRRLFGSDVIQIIPKGSVGIDLGVRYQKSGTLRYLLVIRVVLDLILISESVSVWLGILESVFASMPITILSQPLIFRT